MFNLMLIVLFFLFENNHDCVKNNVYHCNNVFFNIFIIYRRMQDFAVLDSIPDVLYPKVLP